MSPANTAKRAALSSPTACSSTARTDSSAEVEATASVHPAPSASPTIRAIPRRAGQPARADHLLVARRLAPVPVGEQLRLPSASRGKPVGADEIVGQQRAIRSLPPPIPSFSPYSSSDQITGSPTSSKVSLKAAGARRARCRRGHRRNRRSVPASPLAGAPSAASLPAEPNIAMWYVAICFTAAVHVPEHRRRIVLARVGLTGIRGGHRRTRSSTPSRCSPCAPTGDQVGELRLRRARSRRGAPSGSGGARRAR